VITGVSRGVGEAMALRSRDAGSQLPSCTRCERLESVRDEVVGVAVPPKLVLPGRDESG